MKFWQKCRPSLFILAGFLIVTFFLCFEPARAAGLVPCGGSGENPCTVRDAFVLIARVTNWLIAMAGVYAVYEIINNSFWLVVTMGNEESITKRKTGIGNAVFGFIFVLCAYMLVNTAVNGLLLRGSCKFELNDPLNYLTINNKSDTCKPK
jgi:hypothetical protein